MFQQHESYRKATCLFLATLEHEPCVAGRPHPTAVTGTSGHWTETPSLIRRDRPNSFSAARQPSRPRRRPRRDVRTLGDDRVWGVLLLNAKSAQIRSPPVRYFHKAIANTLFSRQATGNVTETEMAMIDVALTGIPLRLINGTQLRGSRRRQTPAAPVPVHSRCSPAPAGRRSEEGPTSSSTHLSPLSTPEIDRPLGLRHTSGDHTPRRSVSRADTTQTDELEHLHFAGYATTARQTAGLKAAHQHISILQRWNKAQDKITSKLKSKEVSTGPQSVHARRSPLRTTTSHHDTTGGRPLPPEPPRHSSFEPRQQRKRRFGEPQAARPSGAGADADLPFRRCSSTSRPTAPTDHTPPTRAPPDQYVPYTTERAAPTTVPTYTQESMQEDLDDFIYGRR
ncbi:unnamed protein product [Microthlaspi erraticum]|uniref:Arabidopsis retrotransposon Orf1 C-terminal domain-containing protein n=1 Tax=Microthlaspi erraticum TaxID=1685480 RepID=A0A6D2IIL9_9BRAS|nr:unnamed protein product [Microthlaspi erraticum]